MASTKEIFSKGLNYILREIKDQKEMYETGLQYLRIVEQRITINNRLNANKHISKIKTDLQVIKEQIRRSEKDFKYYVEHYGYTEDEINNRAKNQKYNIHPATDEELQADLEENYQHAEKLLQSYQLNMLLSEKYDKNNAILEIHPGAGGTESQDWGSMLLRMYTRWASQHDFKVETVD